MTKQNLRKLYPGLSYRNFISPIINRIIEKERNVNEKVAKATKSITPKEFEVFKTLIGNPIAGGDVMEHTPTKDYLVRKFYKLPSRLIISEINEIIKENRKYDDSFPVYDKILTPKEYKIFKKQIL